MNKATEKRKNQQMCDSTLPVLQIALLFVGRIDLDGIKAKGGRHWICLIHNARETNNGETK